MVRGVLGPGVDRRVKAEPRILVLAPDDTAVGPLCQGLDSVGWRTVTARSLATALAAVGDLPVEALVVDARLPLAGSWVSELKTAAAPRMLPTLAVAAAALAPEDRHIFDLAMSGPGHPGQVRLRLEALMRAAVAEEEIALRAATFASRGVDLPTGARDPAPFRVLAAGPPDHRFLALSNALVGLGCEVIAAPTPYTAFDYLHERAFDAAVLWSAGDRAPAQSIAAGMKRNTRLHQIPIVLYLSGDAGSDLNDLYGRGFADVAEATTPEPETAERIVALARAYRDHQGVRRALEAARASGLTDPSTGLFTDDLFAAHLGRVVVAAAARRRPISVCVLKVAPNAEVRAAREGGWLNRALPQIGAMISRLIRVEDTAARLSPEVFALALPATDAGEARLVAERIAAVIACTAFDAGPGQRPFTVAFDVGVAERNGTEAPGALLERASHDTVPAAAAGF
jgi:two-component system, cell cycle response regulator PopA